MRKGSFPQISHVTLGSPDPKFQSMDEVVEAGTITTLSIFGIFRAYSFQRQWWKIVHVRQASPAIIVAYDSQENMAMLASLVKASTSQLLGQTTRRPYSPPREGTDLLRSQAGELLN